MYCFSTKNLKQSQEYIKNTWGTNEMLIDTPEASVYPGESSEDLRQLSSISRLCNDFSEITDFILLQVTE